MRRRVIHSIITTCVICVTGAVAIQARAADTLAVGDPVEEAIAANFTADGLTFMATKAKSLVPSNFPVPDTNNTGTCQDFNLFNAALEIDVKDIQITPQAGAPGRLVLELKADAWGANSDYSSDDPNTFYNYTLGRLNFDFCLFSCANSGNEWALIRMLPPTGGANTIDLNTNLFLELVPDQTTGIPQIVVSTDLDAADINVTLGPIDGVGCSAANIIGTLVSCCLSDLISVFIEQQVVDMVHNDLIPTLQDALNQSHIQQEFDIQGATVSLELYPSDLDIRDDGLTVVMSSVAQAPVPNLCTTTEPTGSRFTNGALPVYYPTATGIGPYHAGASIADDFVNQILYAAWEAGLLCMDLEEFGGEPLDASFLALAGLSGTLARMDTPENAPLLILIRGNESPWVDYGKEHLVNLHAERLELGLMTQVHDRMARIVALEIGANAGADISVAPDGMLDVAIDLSADSLDVAVSYDEVVGRDADALPALIPVLLESFLPDLTGIIPEINLGDLGGVGVDESSFVADGDAGDFLSAYTRLVETAPGCNSNGTCGVNLGGSCSVGGQAQRTPWATLLSCLFLFAVAPLGFVWWRRRKNP